MVTTVYISKDNEDKWAAIENKSGWINDVLSGQEDDFERKVKRVVKAVLPDVLRQLQGL
jgi:hypothetical protein